MQLKYTVNSVCRLEEEGGKPLREWLKTDVSAVRALIWCGLIHENPSLTPEEAGRMMDERMQSGCSLAALAAQCADGLEKAGFFAPPEKRAPSGGSI